MNSLQQEEPGNDIRRLIADYMENGFLENIIDMYRHDSGLYCHVGDLIQDERVRVRLGITALIEELKRTDGENIGLAVPSLINLLNHNNPVVRGDAINLLGIIGSDAAIPHLEKMISDPVPSVSSLSREAIEEILSSNNTR